MAGALNRVPEDAESTAPPTAAESGLVAAPRPVPARPRPVSMPPQPFHAPDPDPPPHRKHRESASTRSGRSNRILGDYTVGKTLGAGSMGKVKLAVHNVSAEKVRLGFSSPSDPSPPPPPSSPSRFFPELAPHLRPTQMAPQTLQQQSRLPRMLPRKSAHSARPPSPCYSTTPTSVACAK